MKTSVAIGIGIVLAVLVGVWLYRQTAIDSCLDRGGRWDHATNTCEEDPDRDAKMACAEAGGTWDYRAGRCGSGR